MILMTLTTRGSYLPDIIFRALVDRENIDRDIDPDRFFKTIIQYYDRVKSHMMIISKLPSNKQTTIIAFLCTQNM